MYKFDAEFHVRRLEEWCHLANVSELVKTKPLIKP